MKLRSRRKFLTDTIDVAKAIAAASAAPATSLVSALVAPTEAQGQMAPLVAMRQKKTKIVSAGGGGEFRTSLEGINWTSLSTLPLISSPDADWFDVAWNGSVYCCIGEGAALATSSDAVTWTARTSPFTSGGYRIISNGSTFLALAYGSSNSAATSTDGISWTLRTLPTTATWFDVVWNGTIYCAIAQDSAIAATSTDGITWTQRTMATNGSWYSLAWNGNVFCAVGANGEVDTSPDGITWTARTGPASSSLVQIQNIGTTFYVSDFNTSKIYTSTDDGVSWSQAGTTAPFPAVGFACSGTNFVIFYGGTVYYSTDTCATWSGATPTGTSNGTFKALRYLNGLFLKPSAQSGASFKGMSTAAPAALGTWTSRTMPSASIVGQFFGNAKSSTSYCLVPYTNSNKSLVSTDGVTWSTGTLPATRSWSAVAWNGSVFCAVPYTSSNGAATSADGVTWTARTLSATRVWVDIVWNGSLFCALSGWSASTVASTSPDGITWTTRTLPSVSWRRLVWNGSVFVAIGYNTATCATSPDGITWTSRTLPSSTSWLGLAWTGTKFVAIALDGSCAVSSDDGATWSSGGSIGASGWYQLSWNGENLIANGSTGIALSANQGATWGRVSQTSPQPSGQFGTPWIQAK